MALEEATEGTDRPHEIDMANSARTALSEMRG